MDSIITKITSVQIPVYLVVIICVLLIVFGFVCIKCKSMIESMTDVKPYQSGDCAESNIETTGIYVCGPPPMMDGIISGLKSKKNKKFNLHFEKFSL